jgi:hypothetical protein
MIEWRNLPIPVAEIEKELSISHILRVAAQLRRLYLERHLTAAMQHKLER